MGDSLRSISDVRTQASRQVLYDMSLSADFMGLTGRVRQFNSVSPRTSPPSHGDREGIILFRQAPWLQLVAGGDEIVMRVGPGSWNC